MPVLFSSRSGAGAATAFAALAAACASVPDAPLNATPDLAAGERFQATGESQAPLPDWWAGFDDPELARRVEAALQASPVLRGADASVAEADALLRLALLSRSPATQTAASATAARPVGGADDVEARGALSLAANWEMDVFGQLGAAIDAARFDAAAARELRRDFAVTIASETALAYIDLRTAEARLAVSEANAAAQAESLVLIRTLYDNGRATALDVARAESQFELTRAAQPVFRAAIAEAESRLAAFTGRAPTLPSEYGTDAAPGRIPALAMPLIAGTPAELIRRRPDIRLAEARIGSALALGAAARASLFPRVTLGADLLGLVSDTGVAFNEDSIGLSVGPVISWSGPDLRRVYAGIEARDARTRAAAADYEAAVLNALAEAETALSGYAAERARRANLEAAVIAAKRAYELARLRFEQGLDSSLDVLDAQRTLLSAEDQLAVNAANIARRAVAAYRSLGGIWTDAELAAFRAEQEPVP